MKFKMCTKCKNTKPFSDFYKDKIKNDGLSSWCKTCLKNHSKEGEVKKRRVLHNKKLSVRERIREYDKNLYQIPEQRDKKLERAKKYRERPDIKIKNIEYRKGKKYKNMVKEWNLLKKYNLTIEEYNKILEKQNNGCAICGKKEKHKSLAVDHCHKNNRIRGLLCQACNTSLGQFQDNIDLLKKAIKYLTN